MMRLLKYSLLLSFVGAGLCLAANPSDSRTFESDQTAKILQDNPWTGHALLGSKEKETTSEQCCPSEKLFIVVGGSSGLSTDPIYLLVSRSFFSPSAHFVDFAAFRGPPSPPS